MSIKVSDFQQRLPTWKVEDLGTKPAELDRDDVCLKPGENGLLAPARFEDAVEAYYNAPDPAAKAPAPKTATASSPTDSFQPAAGVSPSVKVIGPAAPTQSQINAAVMKNRIKRYLPSTLCLGSLGCMITGTAIAATAPVLAIGLMGAGAVCVVAGVGYGLYRAANPY